MRPVWIVVGTDAPRDEALLLWESALYIANLHYVTTEATVRVFLDTQLTLEEAQQAGQSPEQSVRFLTPLCSASPHLRGSPHTRFSVP